MDYRSLGNTGRDISVIGLGGLVVKDTTDDEAARIVEEAFRRGIRYFDVAPTYGDAEERLGPALETYRDEVFLACKTTCRDAGGAREELHRSLDRLRTDHVDLYQLHALNTDDDLRQVLGPGGAMEAFAEAREQGLIRHVGFSSHDEDVAIRLLQTARFETAMLPVNLLCWRDGGFGPRLLANPAAREVGLLGLKSLARRPLRKDEARDWPKCWYVPFDTPEEVRQALAFTLSRPVAAALSPSHAELLWMMCDAVEDLRRKPIEDPEQARLQGEPLFAR